MTTTKGSNFVMSWTPDRFLRRMDESIKRGLELAAIEYEGELKRVISKPGPMKGKMANKQKERMAAAGEVRRASKPGEPPRRRHGVLRSSIGHASRLGGLVQRVGSSVAYARHLEWGTTAGRLKARPFFRPTLRRMVGQLTGIIAREVKRGG